MTIVYILRCTQRLISLVVTLAIAAACSTQKQDAGSQLDSSVRRPETSAPSANTDGSISSWRITEFGIGPLRAGMPVSAAVAALRSVGITATANSSNDCGYLQWRGGPPGLSVMIGAGLLARIDVDSGTIATREGARIGDTEARIQSLYPGRVIVAPHKYTNGHYLVVTPTAVADSAFRIVFETENERVTKYRAGKRPQVEYVERCG